uniref:Putative secreted protein n=1 Tax=Ixodes ricinus TaxID=34613 RepID=A0A6B0UB86_IXORI
MSHLCHVLCHVLLGMYCFTNTHGGPGSGYDIDRGRHESCMPHVSQITSGNAQLFLCNRLRPLSSGRFYSFTPQVL